MRRLLGFLLTLTALGASAAAGTDDTVMQGEYFWKDGGERGAVSATFQPSGDRRWNVEFHFRFDGRDHTYTGTAEGAVGEGSLAGTVQTENGRRTFSFRGTVRNGAFEGTHSETGRGREYPTGTLSMKVKS